MQTKCGTIALIGKPNVGKSTLLNRLVGEKLCITSHKPQTTRHRILGIKTQDQLQFIFVDTPGMHSGQSKALNRQMNKTAQAALTGVDLIVMVIDHKGWHSDDDAIYARAQATQCPLLLVYNKVDNLDDKGVLLPIIEQLNQRHSFAQIIPLSAKKGDNLGALEKVLAQYLPNAAHQFAADELTDKNMRFLVCEILREKLFRSLGQELPYSTTVAVESFKEQDKCTHIQLIIWVEKPGQKGIVIGKQGERLKSIVSKARQDMEQLLTQKVFLQVWVKVREGWSDDSAALQSLGYDG